MQTILWTLLFSFSFPAFALTIPEVYRNGQEVCEKSLPQRAAEKPLWVSVPVSYENPAQGTFPLYAWTHADFDPRKNTLVFVSGGPGETAHGSRLKLSGWNVVFFDQRGNTCSRPPLKSQYLNPSFYSSLNTARDIEEIRKALGVKQISVYGVSYGTVPAHLYGSNFPSSTRAVVLEGVIFEGGPSLMQPERRLKILQKFFDSLPGETQDRILELSRHPGISANWFSKVGMFMLYMDDSLAAFTQYLNNIIWDTNLAVSMLKSFDKTEPVDTDFGMGHVLMGMIGCQEMGMNLPGFSFFSVFAGRKLVPDGENHLRIHYCESLGLANPDPSKFYQAELFPSSAPTTYFQGVYDGATPASAAVSHFKRATRGFSQLVLVNAGGHIPVYGTLASGYSRGAPVEVRAAALSKALRGELLSSADLRDLSQNTDLKWVSTSKNP